MSSESLDQLLQSGNITVAVRLDDLRKIVKEAVASLQPPDDPGGDRYLTAEQTCNLLSVNRSTLWRWQRAGILAPCRIGGLVRYRERDILSLMQNDDA